VAVQAGRGGVEGGVEPQELAEDAERGVQVTHSPTHQRVVVHHLRQRGQGKRRSSKERDVERRVSARERK
jgi:hypothetical protein